MKYITLIAALLILTGCNQDQKFDCEVRPVCYSGGCARSYTEYNTSFILQRRVLQNYVVMPNCPRPYFDANRTCKVSATIENDVLLSWSVNVPPNENFKGKRWDYELNLITNTLYYGSTPITNRAYAGALACRVIK